jgi:hypothetical protein
MRFCATPCPEFTMNNRKRAKAVLAAGHASPLSFRLMFRYPLRDPAEPDRTACPTLPSDWGLDCVGRRLRS